MRVLFWYCDVIGWTPTLKTLEDMPDGEPGRHEKIVAAFIHVEPRDVEEGSAAETKLVKNAKWLARKWDTKEVLLHSFTHLGEDKADPEESLALIRSAQKRLSGAGYLASCTPFGHFHDLELKAPGHPLARIYKQW